MTHRFTPGGSYAGLLCESTTSVETNLRRSYVAKPIHVTFFELSKELDEALEVQTSIHKSASAKPAQAHQPTES